MFDRNSVIAIVLVILILISIPTWNRLVNPSKPMPPQTTQTPPPAADTTRAPAPIARAADSSAAAPAKPSGERGLLAADTLPLVREYVTVETPLFVLALGSNGLVSRYDLKKFRLQNGDVVDLHAASAAGNPAVGTMDFDFGDRNPHSLKDLRFKASKTAITLSESGEDSVTLMAGDSAGPKVRLTYVFNGGRYGYVVALRTENLPPPETGEYRADWKGSVPVTEPDTVKDLSYAAAYARVGDEVVDLTVGKDPKKDFTATGQTGFVAVRSKYFIAALIPAAPAAGTEILGRNLAPHDKNSAPFYDASLRHNWGRDAAGRWTVYWGPIRYDNLRELNAGLEETMSWGWSIIKPISRLILWALIAMHKAIPNYGIVIIVFAIFIKLLLWPLTRKSQISMKKMSALQPEIQELREIHKNNAPEMNKQIMRLYKERGVNPASGCLMLLPQMPVLYALYAVFSSTIEFRHAAFFGWINDLSQPDFVAALPFTLPLYGGHFAILPVVMGITQFFMAKRTATDPNQKAMLYIMPIFMTLIFNSMPSGLTLYWTLFNVLALGEQYLIKVPDFTPSVSVIEEKGQKARKPKSQNS